MKRLLLPVALVAFAAVSCRTQGGRTFETIPYVKAIVADTTSAEYGLLRAADPSDSKGSIAIIGEPEEAVYLTEKILTSDRYDNITGRGGKDILPDFAGERVDAVLDVLHAPYGQFGQDGRERLREATVRGALLSLDTLCRLNSFNEDAVAGKQRAKIIVLTSSLSYADGYADVDTLLKMASRDIPVVSPVESLLSQAFKDAQGTLNIGVWAGREVEASGAYRMAFERYAAAAPKGLQASLSVLTPDNEGAAEDRFIQFLDLYLEKGSGFPMSVLLLDDFGVSVERLEAAVATIRKMETPEAVEYNKLLAPDFRFIDASEAVVADIYGILRSRNLFTHNIAYPRVAFYQTIEAGGQPVLVPSNEKNISPDLLEFINENTLVSKKYYAVQGKH